MAEEVGEKLVLRGLLYRKLIEKKEKAGLPKFYVKKPEKVELEKPKDVTKVDISYLVIDPFATVRVIWDPKSQELVYNVIEPELTEEDKETIREVSASLMETIDIDLSSFKGSGKILEYLEGKVLQIIEDQRIEIKPQSYLNVLYYIYRNFVGMNDLEALMQDSNVEDISCDGTDIPIFVIHRIYGSIKTNISFSELDSLRDLIVKMSQRAGRYVSYAEPILDATLPDGSRVAATLATDVATRGSTFTIRKFSEHPFSPIELMQGNTASSEIMSYLWYLVQNKSSAMVVGGTATGKTSLLNSLAMFIPPEAKIVSIEDTRELRLPHQHWISGVSREGFGIPTSTGQKYGEVTMFDLLKETFRQNPDYVIVGETRGEETYVMFQGMASGHPSMTTFHAAGIDTLVRRLTTAPINLSPTLLESLGFIIVMTHAKEKGASARRVKEVVEIVSVDPRTNEVATNITFRWDPVTDKHEKVNDSVAIRRISNNIGISYEDALKELERRRLILEWMSSNDIKHYIDVTSAINTYYKEPATLLKKVGLALEAVQMQSKQPKHPAVEIVKIETEPAHAEHKKRTSILELLGFRAVRESENG